MGTPLPAPRGGVAGSKDSLIPCYLLHCAQVVLKATAYDPQDLLNTREEGGRKAGQSSGVAQCPECHPVTGGTWQGPTPSCPPNQHPLNHSSFSAFNSLSLISLPLLHFAEIYFLGEKCREEYYPLQCPPVSKKEGLCVLDFHPAASAAPGHLITSSSGSLPSSVGSDP